MQAIVTLFLKNLNLYIIKTFMANSYKPRGGLVLLEIHHFIAFMPHIRKMSNVLMCLCFVFLFMFFLTF